MMRELKDNEYFVDYGSYDDLLEDIKISGHVFSLIKINCILLIRKSHV